MSRFVQIYQSLGVWCALSCSIISCLMSLSMLLQVALEISFMEAVQGCTKTVSFQAAKPCEACGMHIDFISLLWFYANVLTCY